MNKSKFLELIKNPDLIEEKDLSKLAELTAEHPYSQIIHALNVKGRKILNKPDFEKALNLAATYSYDRKLLHSMVEGIRTDYQGEYQQTLAPASPDLPPNKSEESVVEETSDFEWINEDLVEKEPSLPQTTSETVVPPAAADPIDSDPNLEIDDHAKESAVEESNDEKEIEQEIQATETSEVEENIDKKKIAPDPVKSVPESSEVESDKGPGPDQAQEPDTSPQKSEDSLNLEIEASGIHAELMKNLNQLQESRQQYEGQSDENGDQKNRKEQIEIVDNFIKNSPVLSKANLSAESEILSQKDLSKDSGKFSDEMASENLAKIFLKQGKRKDAEKIYKKLITKFPQKKTYFAIQIEKLKKK